MLEYTIGPSKANDELGGVTSWWGKRGTEWVIYDGR